MGGDGQMARTLDDVTNMKMNIYFGCNEGGPGCERAPGSWTPGGAQATDSHKYYQMALASVDEKYRIRAAAHTATSFGVSSVLHAVCPRRALS